MTTATAVDLPEAQGTHKERSITYRYDTGQIHITEVAGEEVERGKILMTIQVGHTKGGMNYFSGRNELPHYSVIIINETERDGVIGFTMGSGKALHYDTDKAKRFSKPRLTIIAAEWKERIEGVLSLDEDQLDDGDRALREWIMPFWLGQKVGIR
jgi:hypothetical protein